MSKSRNRFSYDDEYEYYNRKERFTSRRKTKKMKANMRNRSFECRIDSDEDDDRYRTEYDQYQDEKY